jgi:hypothetical protein
MAERVNWRIDAFRGGTTQLVDLAGPRDGCGAHCAELIDKWETWYDRAFDLHPPAMIAIADQAAYLQLIGAKSRNMLRKAVRHGYTFEPFDRNDQLDAIYAINRSKPVRSGGAMRRAYLERPAPLTRQDLCGRHGLESVGMFVGPTLVAYAHLVGVNQLVIINTILGHADHLPNGVMNALIAATVDGLNRNAPYVRYLNYTTLTGPEGLTRFKESVGFAETPLERKR